MLENLTTEQLKAEFLVFYKEALAAIQNSINN
jgi:hypothetical protein